MSEQIRAEKKAAEKRTEPTADKLPHASHKSAEEVKAETDALLDEIEGVLEENAEAHNLGPHVSGHRRTERAKYRYFNGDNKHPYEWKACATCGAEAWMSVRSTFCSTRCSKMGALNPTWKGDNAGYVSLHARVYRERGKAFGCSTCGQDDPHKRYEWANLTGHYEDTADYASMCAKCHRAFDNSRRPDLGRRVYTEALLAQAAEMRKTMKLREVAECLGVSVPNLCTLLKRRAS